MMLPVWNLKVRLPVWNLEVRLPVWKPGVRLPVWNLEVGLPVWEPGNEATSMYDKFYLLLKCGSLFGELHRRCRRLAGSETP